MFPHVSTQTGSSEEAVFHVRVSSGREREDLTSATPGSGLTQGEAPGVDVHLGETQVFEGGGQGEGCLHGDVTQQIRLFLALLQLVRRVVQHLLVPVADLLHLQPVDLPTQADQLAGQAVILDLHLPLWTREQHLKVGEL